jgi:predicted DNA-binding transcriptional regulator AlpA
VREQLAAALRDLENAAARARAALEAQREAEAAVVPISPSTPVGDRLLTAEQVALALGLDVGSVTRRRFPFRIKLGRRTVRYSEAGLRRWIRSGGIT